MKYHYLLTISYDGSEFCGWAKQIGKPTIQGSIEKALKVITKSDDFHTLGASKTDAKVHAKNQKVWVNIDFEPNIEGFIMGLNKALPSSIRVKDIKKISSDFLVRNCKQKTYVYVINNGEYDVFRQRFEFNPKKPLEAKKLESVLNLFVGEHNFLNFSGIKEHEIGDIKTVRKIEKIEITHNKDRLEIRFTAKGFIRYQIRMMMGAAIAFAENKITLEQIQKTLDMKEPKLRYKAEPQGLILEEILY